MTINRRHMMQLAGGGVFALTLMPKQAWADKPAMNAAIKNMFGDRDIIDDRIALTIPPLAENGFSVALDVEAKSPMSADDYVKRIAIFSDRNPIPLIASYNFTPLSGRAKVSGKIRLGGSQTVHAVAEMSDGTLYGSRASTLVTLAACVIG